MRWIALPVLLFASCTNKGADGPTYKPYSYFYNDSTDVRIETLKLQLSQLKVPEPVFQTDVATGWYYIHSDGQTDSVTLPHRFVTPDTDAWYSNYVDLPFPDPILEVRADDGAQVTVNDRDARRIDGNFFAARGTGSAKVRVRVMNNAMTGGLKSVRLLKRGDFDQYVRAKGYHQRLRRLVEKCALLQKRDEVLLQKVAAILTRAHSEGLTAIEEDLQTTEARYASHPILVGPHITYLDSSRIVISVVSEDDQPVTLAWGPDSSALASTERARGPIATFRINTLNEGRVYYYRVSSGKTVTSLNKFRVPASSDESFSFNVWADSQSGWPVFRQLVALMRKGNDTFSIGIGDLVGNGADEGEWLKFFQSIDGAASSIPYYLLAGNHDYDGYYDSLRPGLFNAHTSYEHNTYYAWKFNNCAFIALDPNGSFPIGIKEGSAQHEWLLHTMKSGWWASARWRFVLIHQPPFSQGWKDYHGDAVVRDLIEPLIEPYKIDFVLSGHTHDYERLTRQYGEQKTTFIIVGGGGGGLEPPESSEYPLMDTLIKTHHYGRFNVHPQKIRFEVRNTENELIDSIILNR